MSVGLEIKPTSTAIPEKLADGETRVQNTVQGKNGTDFGPQSKDKQIGTKLIANKEPSLEEKYNPEGKGLLRRAWDYLVEEQEKALPKDSKLKMTLDFVFKVAPGLASQLSLFGNFLGFGLELSPISRKILDKIERVNTWITRLSFTPYGMDGILTGLKNRNFWQAFSFAFEPIFALMGDLKDIFLIRGFSCGVDQLPMAVQGMIKEKFGKLKFDTWSQGFTEVPKALWQVTKELVTNPIDTLFTMKPKGHIALLSSLGDIFASIGYLASGRKHDKFFGWIRDISSLIFDWELWLHKTTSAKFAGTFFMLEDILDGFARYAGPWRLAVNQLAHAAGRFAVECYKNSYKEAQDMDKAEMEKKVALVKNGEKPELAAAKQ